MRKLLLAAAVALAGCQTLPADPSKMAADQLREWVKDKTANISCGVVNSPYGRGVMTSVALDKAVIFNGTVTVDGECKVSVTNDSRKPEVKP